MGDTVEKERVGNITPGIVDSMLENYFPHARYLTDPHYSVKGGCPSIYDNLRIEESCYCNKTGHFNAAEFILCANQLGFVLFSEAIERGDVPEMGLDNFEEFQRLRLGNIYITGVKDMKFRRAIDSKRFRGDVHIARRKPMRGNIFYKLDVNFSDSSGGKAHGLIDVVAVT